MSLRLPHVLALMALILAAGVLSVRHLESGTGAGTVPGVIVVEAPWLDARGVAELTEALDGPGMHRALEQAGVPVPPGATPPVVRIQWVAAGEGPLQPFGTELAERRAHEGAGTVLVRAGAPADEAALRRGWRVLIARPEASDPVAETVQVAADFVRRQTGVRAFLLAVDPGPRAAAADNGLSTLITPLVAAAQSLPRTRRTSLLLLGEREPDAGRRVGLRIDIGPWAHHARPGLLDLLEERW
jgi:hypothetical protein